jgi:hypothetical protein
MRRVATGSAVTALAGLLGSFVATTPASAAAVDEYTVKAAYLLNFARFVEWPLGSSCESFQIVVVGEDPFGDLLDAVVAGQRLAGRPVSVARWSRMREPRPCSVVFVSAGERLDRVRAAAWTAPALLVGDGPDFMGEGGMVAFVREGGRIRFDVDVEATAAAGLRFGSRVLGLARQIRGVPRGAQ